MTRILLADDHGVTLNGIQSLLRPYYEIVGEAANGRALVEAALRLKPDLIILDITMPLLNGVDAAVEIRKSLPGVNLLFLTMHRSAAYLAAALNAGATGYVLKTSAASELLEAVTSVLNGGIYVSPSLSGEHLERFSDPASAAATLRLSPREREVLQLIAEGHTAKEIGARLNISARTAVFHRENIGHKLGLRGTADLTKYANEQGVV
jgi:DNA-binding NarL/FixJ family response regulator